MKIIEVSTTQKAGPTKKLNGKREIITARSMQKEPFFKTDQTKKWAKLDIPRIPNQKILIKDDFDPKK